MVVTFCGHSEIFRPEEARKWLKSTLTKLIEGGAEYFYLGGYGAFDALAKSVLVELKETYPHIQRILVLAYLNRKTESDGYDLTTYPPLESVPKRYAITHRNR